MKKRVLFLCTHNSARSQIAEGLLRNLTSEQFEVCSAGTERTRVQPLAIQAMREIGIDISGHRSKTLDEFAGEQFDYVITVCDRANESCPIFPGTTERIHWSFDDPTAATGSEEQKLRAFRTVRDAIQQRLRMFLMIANKSDGKTARRCPDHSMAFDGRGGYAAVQRAPYRMMPAPARQTAAPT